MNKVIGLGCIARVGKDHAFKILQKYLPVERIAFADELKVAVKPISTEYLGIDAFTENPEEKRVLRPVLVAFGNAVRTVNRRAWIQRANGKVIETLGRNKIAVITDVRFDEIPGDEADYVQKELGGILVNLDRKMERVGDEWKMLQPANESENLNYPKFKARADVKIEALDLAELEHELVEKVIPFFA